MAIYDDPWDYFFGQRANEGLTPSALRARTIEPLDRATEDSLLSKVAAPVLSGVHWIGNRLDETFGGRAVRGTLAGKPRELLSILPFSDTLGITDVADRTSGQDLARQWGLADEGIKGQFETQDLIGPALEIALDPATYLSLGASALTKAGQNARRLGIVPDTALGRIRGFETAADAAKRAGVPESVLAQRAAHVGIDLGDVVGRPLGGLASVGVPFSGVSTPLGTGPVAEGIAEKVANLSQWLGERAPMTWLKAGFSKIPRGRTDPIFQRLAYEAEPQRLAREAATRSDWHQVAEPLLKLGQAGELDRDLMFRFLERQPVDVSHLAPEIQAALEQARSIYEPLNAARLQAAQAAGVPLSPLSSVYGTPHVHRQSFPVDRTSAMKAASPQQAMETRFGPIIQRESFLDMPGGTAQIHQALADPRIGTLNRAPLDPTGAPIPRITADAPGAETLVQQIAQAAEAGDRVSLKAAIERLVGGDPKEIRLLAGRVARLRREGQRGLWKNWPEEIVPALNTARQDRAATRTLLGQDYFNYNPERYRELATIAQDARAMGPQELADFMASAEGAELRQLAHARKAAPRLARWLGQQPAERAAQGVFQHPLQSILSGWQATDEAIARGRLAQDYLAQVGNYTRLPEPGTVPALDVLSGLGMNQEARQSLLAGLNDRGAFGLPPGRIKDVQNIHLTPEQASVLTGVYSKGGAPTWLSGPANIADQFLNLFRMGVLSWPARHVRDLTSSTWQNLTEGVLQPFRSMNEARLLFEGQAIPGIAEKLGAVNQRFAGLTDEAATKLIGQMMFEGRAAGHQAMAPVREILGPVGDDVGGSFRGLIPGAIPHGTVAQTVAGKTLAYDKPLPELLNPFNIRGMGGRTESRFLPAQWSEHVGRIVDDSTRGGSFIDFLKQGYAPEAAAAEALRIHPDWTKLSDFERNWIRRIVPFYSWHRHVTPQVASNLYRSPGGVNAQAIRIGNLLEQQSGFMPPYLGGGLAIPVGDENETGVRRYLTRLDLPFENPLELFRLGPGGLPQTGLRFLGQTNPLIKAPLEYVTGKQFHSGREMEELYSRTGIPLLDQTLSNIPTARLTSTIGTLLDPRKWADPTALVTNLLTGVRLSDVDVEKSRLQYGPRVIREMLQGNPNVRTFEEISVPDEKLANLSPEELKMLQLYRSLQRNARTQAKQR